MTATEKTRPASCALKTPAAGPGGRRITLLIIGDALAFLIFALIGRGSHAEANGLAALPQVALTALPFAAAWFIVAPFVGAFRRDVSVNPRRMIIHTAGGWLLSWPLAVALRGIFVDHGLPPLTFALITLVFNMGILLLWRWPFALASGLEKKPGTLHAPED
jgi:Protein of unknown function (DUF3054)